MEFKNPYWMQMAEEIIRPEFDDHKKFYETYGSAPDFYNELAKRIVVLADSDESDEMSAYKLMYETYAHDVRECNHEGLDTLIFTYYTLARAIE